MQHTYAGVPFSHHSHQSQRHTMVTAYDTHLFSGLDPSFRLLVHILVQLLRSLVDPTQTALYKIRIESASIFQMGHDLQGLLTQPITARIQRIIHLQSANPLFPSAWVMHIVKIYLHGGVQNRIRSLSGTSTIRGCHLPGHREQHQLRLFRGKRHTEIAAIINTGSIGIKIRRDMFFHSQ